MQLEIIGEVPSKKNLLRFDTRTGRTYHDTDIAAAIEALRMRANIAWRQLHHRAPAAPVLVHPDLYFTFYVTNRRSDRDNRLTTVLDVLQAAEILKNDNIANCNGRIIIEPAIVADVERTVIEVVGGLTGK